MRKGIIDVHTHQGIPRELTNADFNGHYDVSEKSNPWKMRTTFDRLDAVKAFFSASYILEPQLRDYTWFPKIIKEWAMSKFKPTKKYHYMFSEPTDKQTFEQLEKNHEMINRAREKFGDKIEIAKTFTDYQRITTAGKIAVIQSIEGAHSLNGKLENLEKFHELGVAHMTIPHFFPNEAGGCVQGIPNEWKYHLLGLTRYKSDPDAGLSSPFGRDLVTEMFRVGMLVDITHGTPNLRNEVYQMARDDAYHRPVVATHVGLSKFKKDPMNMDDEDIRQIADTGGFIGLIAMPYWLTSSKAKGAMDILKKSIDELINKGGEDVIVFGTDFDGMIDTYSDLTSPSDFPRLNEILLSNYKPSVVDKLMYRNAERVLYEGWGR
jgi:membrane dipeptidase